MNILVKQHCAALDIIPRGALWGISSFQKGQWGNRVAGRRMEPPLSTSSEELTADAGFIKHGFLSALYVLVFYCLLFFCPVSCHLYRHLNVTLFIISEMTWCHLHEGISWRALWCYTAPLFHTANTRNTRTLCYQWSRHTCYTEVAWHPAI